MSVPTADEQVRFLSNLQRLLDEGSFVATYKFALLMALAQVSIELGDDSGRPLAVTTRQLAERFVRLYWRQVAPFPSREPTILKAATGAQATILNDVIEARQRFGGSLKALRGDPRAWASLLSRVAGTIEKMPLWKLQTIGRREVPFLYRRGSSSHEIVLEPGVAYCFRRFEALVKDLVQARWTAFVARLPENARVIGHLTDLSEFLFGSERVPLESFQPILRDVQQGKCLYCSGPVKNGGAIDHFIPWSRYPVDLAHNFVLAHGACNANKSDRLAAASHLESWCERNDRCGDEMIERFDQKGLLHDLPISLQIARWAYKQADIAKSLVWSTGRDGMVELDPGWRSLLGEPDGPLEPGSSVA